MRRFIKGLFLGSQHGQGGRGRQEEAEGEAGLQGSLDSGLNES